MLYNYDRTSISSIFEYSKGLVDHCLHDFAPDACERKGKGGLGQLVEELYFGYDVNSNPEADFNEAGVELKCTPLKKSKKDDLLIKERLVCNMIDYMEDYKVSFEESHFYTKCQLMLNLFYLHQTGIERLDLYFLFSVLWKLPEKDLLIIRQDYETIIGKIKAGLAHTLSEGDTLYLGACRKGQKGDAPQKQPFNEEELAPKRAFSLKAAYMRTILDFVQSSGEKAVSNFELQVNSQIVTADELRNNTFDDIVLSRFNSYYGKNILDIFSSLGIDSRNSNSKSKYFIGANAIAGNNTVNNVNRCEEFVKSGLTMKTIRVQKSGRLKESMSFENINYQEVYDCDDWYESRLYELFSSRFMFVVFRETESTITLANGKVEPEYVLDKVTFWTMPVKDLTLAEEYWNHIKHRIEQNQIELKYFWKISDDKKFHVRPKGTKKDDLTQNPNGGMCEKYCYWFNAKYVKEIIENGI